MSWISTDLTVRPQSTASSAMLSRRRALIRSREDSASSSSISPTIERRVVMIRLRIASEKSVTPYTALTGSVILMKAMALVRITALSRVITSCSCTSRMMSLVTSL
ncbi:hypothetical protein D3C78_1206470 [compost metagenome]